MIHPRGAVALLLVAGTPWATALAQSVECGRDDYRCLESAHILACREPGVATLSSCMEWLTRLESHANAEQPTWKLIAGITYITLADLFAETPSESRQWREQGRTIYRELLTRDPTNVQVLLGLSSSSDDPSERIRYLRQALAVDPTNVFVVEGLASNLASIGEPLAAAEILERAYSNQAGSRRWQAAAKAISLYRSAGADERMEAMRRRVYDDVGVEELSATGLWSVGRAMEVLPQICDEAVVEILRSSYCVAAIDSVLQAAVEEEDLAARTRLSEIGADAMLSAGRTIALERDEPNWRAMFRSRLETLFSQGIRSAVLYDAYASFTTDANVRLSALQNAARLAPDNGQIVYRLGLAYMEQEMWAEAIEQFSAARPLLPGWRHEVLDQHIRLAEQNLLGRDTGP